MLKKDELIRKLFTEGGRVIFSYTYIQSDFFMQTVESPPETEHPSLYSQNISRIVACLTKTAATASKRNQTRQVHIYYDFWIVINVVKNFCFRFRHKNYLFGFRKHPALDKNINSHS